MCPETYSQWIEIFLMAVLVADSTQVTLSDDAKNALGLIAGDWKNKQLQVQTVFYTATNEAESLLAGIHQRHSLSLSRYIPDAPKMQCCSVSRTVERRVRGGGRDGQWIPASAPVV